MRKLAASLTLGLVLSTATTFASPSAQFEEGAVVLEVGSALGSEVSGKGFANLEVDGKSGFKSNLTVGLNDRFAFQYRYGQFKSKDATVEVSWGGTISPLTTYAADKLQDFNLLYKITPNLNLVAGYEYDKVTYGKYVQDASKSVLHAGIAANYPVSDKASLFATLVGGKDVSLIEAGVSYKMSDITALNVCYAERKVNDMDVKIPDAGINSAADYTMTGVTFMLAFKM
ncbi:hypothetical protein [Acetonema longum]|uniref:Outer membrane protein beta-barrel domain-containing protein n=1 Tax=Acetonema longum DSM 6540 TaxID=1009370 RepID=F7NDN8_9FIRM|nr:hypothetical protein [Acetonema longum]EGO65900.1 hypothetical protein ALO_00725 [Acetonema longum DSM 6540]